MSNIVSFRDFKVPGMVETAFFQSTSEENERFMNEDLKRSGLTAEDLGAYAPMMRLKEGALAGYGIPYFGLDGKTIKNNKAELLFWRLRLKYPEFSREQRYTQPPADQCVKFGLPSFIPYIHPWSLTNDGDTLVCCEGEKKTVAVLKYLRLPAFGIGGAQMWRDPTGSGGVHPWIRDLATLRGIRKILIVPDGDIYRYDICAAYGTYANALLQAGYEVEILSPGGKIDDLILSWGQDAISRFSALERIDPQNLVQSPSSLITRYNLAFSQNDKGVKTIYQHTSNITKLMQEHSAFPKIWRNLDTNRVMVGEGKDEKDAVPDHTEMQIANYFQHNLGMHKVNKTEIMRVIQYLARENERSPFLEWIRSLKWDGVKRLETWMIDHWGVKDDPFVREVSAKWLVSACARMAKPGTKIDWMLITIGPQGTGKTSMPGILFKQNVNIIYGEHNHKDFHLLLHSKPVNIIDELDSFGKKETSTLKALVTTHEDAFRPPYGASIETFPRRFTLYGCGNRHQFLQHDPSGYRRYAIIEVDRILDFAGLENSRDQLWAEAWDWYNSSGGEGCKFWEIEGASERALRHVISSPEEELILNFLGLEGNTKHTADGRIYFTMSQLTEFMGLGKMGGNSQKVRDIGGVLNQMGIYRSENAIPHPHTKVKQKYYIYESATNGQPKATE